jgi:hypothetical protein
MALRDALPGGRRRRDGRCRHRWFVTGALAAWIAGLSGMSDFEGERGMFAALFVGPIGDLVCMILAIWCALRIGKGKAPLGATLGRLGLVVAGIAAIDGAGIGLRLLAVDTYFNEASPTLEFELRVPRTLERGWHQLGADQGPCQATAVTPL